MAITELVLLILNFTSCIVCLWLSLLKQKLNTTRSMCYFRHEYVLSLSNYIESLFTLRVTVCLD